MIWIAVHLPDFSLQSHVRGVVGSLRSVPLVLSDGKTTRPAVHACNSCALAAGITQQMPITAAQARASGLLVIPREVKKERETLQLVADWLMQFSPMVCLEVDGVSLEITSTLRLFGGVPALLSRIQGGMKALGLNVRISMAPTPLAAWLLAKASRHQCETSQCHGAEDLSHRLRELPLTLFDWPSITLEHLSGLGLVCIGDLLSQSRAGLRRRLGEQVLHDLDRALGSVGDPRVPHCVPETFCSNLDFLFDIVEVERMLVPIRILLNGMEGFLRARGAGASEIVLELKHSRTFVTTHRFGSRSACRNAGLWLQLIRERLAAHPMPEAVIAVKLSAAKLLAHPQQNESWLPTEGANREKWQDTLHRIASRLGDQNVITLSEQCDHRPELAWREDAATLAVQSKKIQRQKFSRSRPLLLMREPRALVTMDGTPQHHGPLVILAGPERISTGWWDGRPVARDYYVAANPRREICWIFRDYRDARRWYLHGYFS